MSRQAHRGAVAVTLAESVASLAPSSLVAGRTLRSCRTAHGSWPAGTSRGPAKRLAASALRRPARLQHAPQSRCNLLERCWRRAPASGGAFGISSLSVTPGQLLDKHETRMPTRPTLDSKPFIFQTSCPTVAEIAPKSSSGTAKKGPPETGTSAPRIPGIPCGNLRNAGRGAMSREALSLEAPSWPPPTLL